MLRQLSGIYLVVAGAFTASIVLAHHPDLARALNATARYAGERGAEAAIAINDHALKPGWAFAVEESAALRERIAGAAAQHPARVAEYRPVPAPLPAAQTVAAMPEPKAPPQPSVTLDLTPPKIPEVAENAAPPPARPAYKLVPQAMIAPPPRVATHLGPSEILRIKQRLRDSLTSDMFDHFELFLYVSKADNGPWAQHMYVFQKVGRDLTMLYNWPVSTGREKIEFTPSGAKEPSFTPAGYYELDPHRFYARYRSMQWNQPMPHAMFFNWEKDGFFTGLAIHGATGDDVGLLGTRSSAGCVRLAPENAALLFSLIRAKYKGLVPRFAYDKKTATIANDGVMMHDTDGRLRLAQGYKVLVFIENYGGENVVAALF